MQLAWRLHHNPIANASSPFVRDLSRLNLTTAQFSTYAMGGFGDGQITIEEPPDALLLEACDHWLGKRIVAIDPAGRVAYEGFVAEVSATHGQSNYKRTLDGFANKLFVEYVWAGSYVGYGKCPKGQQCKGRIALNETDADVDPNGVTQAQLGIKEEWFALGSNTVISPPNARAQGAIKLKDLLRARAADWQSGDTQTHQITLTLWGYYATLQWRKQSLKYKTATEIATIISNALTGKAQYISSDRSQVATTGKSVPFNTNGDALWLQDYIVQLVAFGDNAGRRLFFQIWEDRVPFLFARNAAPRYYVRADDAQVRNGQHEIIPPYLVRAGGIMIDESAEHVIDRKADAMDYYYRTAIEQTDYDDIAEQLTIPAPTEVEMSAERLLARARRRIRNA